MFTPIQDLVKNHWMWFVVNLCATFIASRVIGVPEGSIEKIVALAALMPIVVGIGDSSGNRTIIMIVCAMAMGQTISAQAGHLLKKGVGIALVNGIIWGTVIDVISRLLYGSIGIGLVMMAVMTLNLLLAATAGVLTSIIMEKAGRDSALGNSVLITMIIDSGDFLIFLELATSFLP